MAPKLHTPPAAAQAHCPYGTSVYAVVDVAHQKQLRASGGFWEAMEDRLNCYLCWFAVETHLHDVQCVARPQAIVTERYVASDTLDVFLSDNTNASQHVNNTAYS